MRKFLSLAVFCCLLFGAAHAQKNYTVNKSSFSGVEVTFTSNPLLVNGTEYAGQQFTTIGMNGFTSLNDEGKPALPTVIKLVEMPLGQGLTYEILSYQCDTLDGNDLNIKYDVMPAQPSRRKSDNGPITLVKNNDLYATNQFWGHDVISVEKVGVARDVNLAEVHFSPVKWNPATNQVIVYKNVTVRIKMEETDMAATLQMKALHHSGAFGMTADVINTLGATKEVSNCAPIRYTIIAHSSFRDKFDSFVTWKKRQGFMVDVHYTDESGVGSDTASIHSFLKRQYTEATAEVPAPTYVLFIGDVQQIPAYYCSTGSGWSASSHYSDLYYMCWNSGDNIPDCYYGRFSAQNINQLTPQIEKTLLYEQYAFADPSYLNTGILIAGEDQGMNGDNAYSYADPAMDYIAKTYVNASNGFNTVHYYKNNINFAPTGVTVNGSSQLSATATTLKSLYNQGAGWINYSAHGAVNEWYKPSFTTSDVANMTNNGKPSIMIGNCCQTTTFYENECFAESLLRKGNNAGAVVYFGGSDYTYWSEDFYWAVGVRSNISNTMNTDYNAQKLGTYDRLFHTHGEAFNDWHISAGSMNMAGNMAVQSSNSTLKKYYWEVYHLMGDPSLLPWLGQAQPLTVNLNPSVLMVGSTTLSVEAVPYAYVALTDGNHDLKAAAFANENGIAVLNFEVISMPGDYEVAVTAQNYQPYFSTISAVVADGPFVMIDSIAVVGNANAGDSISFDLYLHNIGNAAVNEYSVEIIANGDHLFTLQGGQDTLHNTIAAEGTYTLTAGESAIWNNVADQTNTTITAIVRWGNHNTEMSRRNYSFVINSANIKAQNYEFSNIAAGSNVTLTVNNKNNGHNAAHNVNSTLISIDPAISVVNGQQSTANLAANNNWAATYTLTMADALPTSGIIELYQRNEFDGKTTMDTILMAFGSSSIETFESGDFTALNWQNNNYPWQITTNDKYAGTYSAKSYNFGNTNNASSELSITWTSSVDDSITFFHKVSSESNYDWFRFYIDNEKMEQSSGPVNDWERSAYMIPAGTHTFTFAYEKDYSQSNGSDCAWIDNITLPMSGTSRNYIMDSICEGDTYNFNGTELSGLAVGDHFFQDSANHRLYFLMLTVNAAPNVSITASETQVRSGEPVVLQANGAERYHWSTGENQSIIRSYPRNTTEYTVTGWNGGCSRDASVTINVNGSVAIENAEENIFNIFPNPATDKIKVRCENMIEVSILNALGQLVQRKSVIGNEINLDITKFNSGIYLIQVMNMNGDIMTQKLIKK